MRERGRKRGRRRERERDKESGEGGSKGGRGGGDVQCMDVFDHKTTNNSCGNKNCWSLKRAAVITFTNIYLHGTTQSVGTNIK